MTSTKIAPQPLVWAEAPRRIEHGDGVMEALIALGKDHVLMLYAEREALPLVWPALHDAAVTEERKRITAELRRRHEQSKTSHNFYACLARELDEGRL